LSLREPKSDGVWYFRINKQFRAYALLKDKDVFVVYRIDNHQKD
jgi:plasmid maintenance system killer protein